tara:strand:+ start:960 stop:1898 length:939 start_codon:yes stop_codon:yes gene_type:complete
MEQNLSTPYIYLSIIISIILYPFLKAYYLIKSVFEKIFLKPEIKEGFFKRAARAVKKVAKRGLSESEKAAKRAAEEAEKAAKEAQRIAEAAAKLLADNLNKIGDELEKLTSKTGDAFSKFSKLEKKIKKVEKETESIFDTISSIPQQVVDFCDYIFVEKIGGIFTQIGGMLKWTLIDPLFTLILAFVGIVVGILNILLKIIEKIISIPGCSIYYLIDSFISLIKLVLPGWLYGFVKTIFVISYYVFLYPIIFILDVIMKFFGSKGLFYLLSSGNCFNFNVGKDVQHMINGFEKVGKVFSTQFGRFDLYPIKI